MFIVRTTSTSRDNCPPPSQPASQFPPSNIAWRSRAGRPCPARRRAPAATRSSTNQKRASPAARWQPPRPWLRTAEGSARARYDCFAPETNIALTRWLLRKHYYRGTRPLEISRTPSVSSNTLRTKHLDRQLVLASRL